MSLTDHPEKSARQAAIDLVASDWEARCTNGESVSVDDLLTSHPELAPDLEQELHRRARIEAARKAAMRPKRQADASPSEASFPHIEGYEILERIGRGGMGVVYRAIQVKLNRAVALKVLPSVIASPLGVERFCKEASAAARFHHTNIVPIYDFGECRDGCYYAMELITGQPLNALILRLAQENVVGASPPRLAEILKSTTIEVQTTGTTETDATDGSTGSSGTGTSGLGRGQAYFLQAARWLADAADALEYVHGQGVIHRDIKPSNIMLSIDGRLMITDFGLAKVEGEGTITMTGSLLGTLRYMSPEQALAGRMNVDHRTDLYSLGATMYELLCFQPAFPGDDNKEIMGAIITRDPKPPRKIVKNVPAELDTICLCLLEKAPEARYSTARDLAEDLRRFVNDIPIIRKRPGPIHRVRKFIRRKRANVVAVVSVMGLLTAVTTGSYYKARAKAEIISGLVKDGLAYDRSGHWDAAAEAYKRVLTADAANIEALNNLARMKKEQYNKKLRETGSSDERLLEDALALCQQALDLEPSRDTVLNTKGVLLKIMKDYNGAAATFEEVKRLYPEFSASWENLAGVYALKKDLDKTEEYLREAVKLCEPDKEDCESPWRNLAAVQLQLGAIEKACTLLDQADDLRPRDPLTKRLHLKLLLERGSVGQSQATVEAGNIADYLADEKDPVVKRLKAMASLSRGDHEAAGRFAQQAINLKDPLAAADYFIVAICEAAAGSPEKAQESLDLADKLWPETLRNPGDYIVTADAGILWFESADQLFQLKQQWQSRQGLSP